MAPVLSDPITTKKMFVNATIEEARKQGYPIEEQTRHGRQINFGHKKLHEQHLQALYPAILQPNANIAALIDEVAPGRPCAHKPMREIICSLTEQAELKR
jgi:hypothetical protein